MNDAAIGKTVRRRRSWYRRRLRLQRTLVAVFVAAVIAGACWQNVARHFSLPVLHASQVLAASFWARGNVRNNLAFAAASSARPTRFLTRVPGVYPYSVIPGGVKNPGDLRAAAAHDYVVRRHFSHFDFSHAQLVRATEAREVYLSYRIRDTVFWTRKRIRLHIGELLLTDGKITARAHCGNQISDAAKPEVSDEEPDEDVLDRPVADVAAAPSLPIRPVFAAPDLPVGEPIAPKLFGSLFNFPYVPVGVPLPYRPCHAGDHFIDGHCVPKHHKPSTVPEPSTLILAASGLALILWRYRRTLRPVTP